MASPGVEEHLMKMTLSARIDRVHRAAWLVIIAVVGVSCVVRRGDIVAEFRVTGRFACDAPEYGVLQLVDIGLRGLQDRREIPILELAMSCNVPFDASAKYGWSSRSVNGSRTDEKIVLRIRHPQCSPVDMPMSLKEFQWHSGGYLLALPSISLRCP